MTENRAPSSRIVFVGEGMLELSAHPGGGWGLRHGGDTLNTAIHMARMACNVAFLSALGSDPLSLHMREDWAAEGLDLSMLLQDDGKPSGLYAISCDEAGERSFTYWRSESAARSLFTNPGIDAALERAGTADLLVFSLITLAILPENGRSKLLELAAAVRRSGGKVAFDGNYRPRLWPDPATARSARDQALPVCDIGLPTLEDEAMLSPGISADEVRAHWSGLGCSEVLLKLGAEGCMTADGSIVRPDKVLAPVDTSGAGDAFNAGYLAARLQGAAIEDSARLGHRIAGWTIMRAGAIPVRDADAPYCPLAPL